MRSRPRLATPCKQLRLILERNHATTVNIVPASRSMYRSRSRRRHPTDPRPHAIDRRPAGPPVPAPVRAAAAAFRRHTPRAGCGRRVPARALGVQGGDIGRTRQSGRPLRHRRRLLPVSRPARLRVGDARRHARQGEPARRARPRRRVLRQAGHLPRHHQGRRAGHLQRRAAGFRRQGEAAGLRRRGPLLPAADLDRCA